MAPIKVKVIQAHSIGLGAGKKFKVGDTPTIDEKDFAPNLYERLSAVKDKEEKGDDTRTKKR